MKTTIWDDFEEPNQQTERLLAHKTNAGIRRAIYELLLSAEELSYPARKLIAEHFHFQQGRPAKEGSGLIAVIAFALNGHDKLRGVKRNKAIAKCCRFAECSREEFRKNSHLLDCPAFRAGLAGKPLPDAGR